MRVDLGSRISWHPALRDPARQAVCNTARQAACNPPRRAVRNTPRQAVFSAAAGCLLAMAMLASPKAVAPERPFQAIQAEQAAPAARPPEVERLAAHIARTWRLPLPTARRIVNAAFAHARAHRLSPTLILAIVAQESGFRPSAQSRQGAQGLMQVIARHHPEKLQGMRRDALLKPETNIQVGARVLAEYLERSNGRLDRALVKYSGNASAYPRKVRLVWADLERVRRTEQA